VVSDIFNVHPYLGKIPILTNIFQMGWNHQPVIDWCFKKQRFGNHCVEKSASLMICEQGGMWMFHGYCIIIANICKCSNGFSFTSQEGIERQGCKYVQVPFKYWWSGRETAPRIQHVLPSRRFFWHVVLHGMCVMRKALDSLVILCHSCIGAT